MPSPDPGSSGPEAAEELLVLLPTYDDWPALRVLLPALDGVLAGRGLSARVLVVDDGSTTPAGPDFPGGPFAALRRVEVLELRRNLGHQRAIAVGLAFVAENVPCRAVVLMDGDGEDDPNDVPRLLGRCAEEGWSKIVFAERARRSESLGFVAGYVLYKALHRLLTGIRVRVGNFSVIPRARLESLVVVSELWNHYAASVFKSRQPHGSVPTHRARRYAGRSRMDSVRLVIHGLSALSVFSEVIGVRMLVAMTVLMLLAAAGLVVTVAVRLTTDLAIPGWATTTAGLLVVILLQAMMFATAFSFITLSGRQGTSFLPRRDYAYFVGRVRTLYPSS